MGDLYRADFALWAAQQADALRSAARGGSNTAVDWENVAEEIESLGRSERSRLNSHIRTVIEHLVKLQASGAARPRVGWKRTIARTRKDIDDVLADNPSLRRELPGIIARQTKQAIALVTEDMAIRGEIPRLDPGTLAFSEDQILGPWLPD